MNFHRSGKTISQVKVTSNKSSSVSFYARIVRSSKRGLALRLADGKTVNFSATQIRRTRGKPSKLHKASASAATSTPASASSVTINIQGLQPGVTVLITETVDSQANVTITIALPTASSPVVVSQQASGIVTEVDTDTFDVQTGDGSDLRMHMAADSLANLNLQVCDTVAVTYHQDAGLLVADSVNDTGTSTSGDCYVAPDPQDAVGTITAVSPGGVTISTQDQGPLTFTVDSSDSTSGFLVGDVVDVTYTQNSDGTLDASDVEYVEQDSTGTVTAVSDGSMTITDDNTGQPDTFTADPGEGMFDGVAIGDQVDVAYHQSSGQIVVDSVDDQAGSSGGGQD